MKTWQVRLCVSVIVLSMTSIGCASRRDQLHRVAKDWCETIRASQIVPVYPLTTDLVPGDLYLVDEVVSKQHEAFERNGFLPLPFNIGRLEPSGWQSHYGDSNLVLAEGGTQGTIGVDRDTTRLDTLLQTAPRAAFPTYSFTVQTGSSFDLALPVSGVPIGLSALGATAAQGTVSIKDVRTYGLDAVSLTQDVRTWAQAPQVQEFLRTTRMAAVQGSRSTATVFVRVISRVYLAREFDISITSRSSRSLGASAGLPSPTEMLNAPSGTEPAQAALEDYKANLKALNASIKENMEGFGDAGPVGGDVRFIAASSRSVTLKEDFAEPMVIGYLGFDMAVLEDGDVGPPIPTFTVLDDRTVPRAVKWTGALTVCENRVDVLQRLVGGVDRSAAIYSIAAEHLDAQDAYQGAIAAGDAESEAWTAAKRVVLPPSMVDPYERERGWCMIADALERAVSEDFEE